MFLLRILPGILKEFVKHVPTVLFEVIDWGELASELPKLSKKILHKDGYEMLLMEQGPLLASYTKLTAMPLPHHEIKKDKALAEKLLGLYFAQLYSPYGIFLDLKLQSFSYVNDELLWHPSPLWIKFDDDFRVGLLDIYDGFYLSDDQLFTAGLVKTGLLSHSWPKEEQDELTQLFKFHFGSSVVHETIFDLEEFKNSIMKISEFMLKKKVKITKDFLYLGIYLVALYTCLEELPYPILVRDVYFSLDQHKKPD